MKQIREEFETKYNPKEFEELIYEKWLRSCCFKGKTKLENLTLQKNFKKLENLREV